MSIHNLLFNDLIMFLILLHRSVHLDSSSAENISYVHGPTSVPLLPLTVSQSLEATVNKWPNREAVVFHQDGVRKTFSQFQHEVGSNQFVCLMLVDVYVCHQV